MSDFQQDGKELGHKQSAAILVNAIGTYCCLIMTGDKTMWFAVLGVMLLVLKLAAIGPLATWSWWVVLAPFAAAAVWWHVADSMGITQRAAVKRQARLVARRREERLDALGLRSRKSAARESRASRRSMPPTAGSGFRETHSPDDDKVVRRRD
jgi:small Trp-rich protein